MKDKSGDLMHISLLHFFHWLRQKLNLNCAASCGFTFLLYFYFQSPPLLSQQSTKRFWISPASVRPDFWSLFNPNSGWDTLRSRIDVFSLHVNSLREQDTASIRIAAKTLKDAGVQVNVECGGLRPFSGCDSLAGERQAQLELSQLYRWYSRGGAIDIITMDSPINTMIINGDPNGTCNWTVSRAANEMVDYMKAVRQALPNVSFALVEPVPWYSVGSFPAHAGNNYGDLLKTLDTVFTVVAQRGERLDIFHSDSPYEYGENAFTQGWKKIKAVEEYLHTKGIRHGRIYNSEQGGFQSDQLFYERTLAAYDKYNAISGDPDEIEVWSWYDHPAKNYPESEPYTFTYICNKFFEKVGGITPPKTFAKFEPPDGMVYHGVGQSNNGVSEYIIALADSTIHPISHNFYYDIPGTRGDKFNELRQTLAAERQIGRIPHLSIAMTDGKIWTDSVIATGSRYDYIIDSIAAICKQFGKRLFVRPGFEFNGWWFPYHPYLYPKAFQKIVERFRTIGAEDSAAFLWSYYPAAPNDFDSVDTQGARWYPGDGYVDWFSLDLFKAGDFHPDSSSFKRGQITTKGKSERFLAMARTKNKPVFLSEVSAAGVNFTSDPIDGANDWNSWFVPFWNFLSLHPEIKGFNYTNWDWSKYGQWKEWGDARIEVNAYILNKYREEMHKTKYIHLPRSISTDVRKDDLPSSFALYQNYPNPFSERTTIRFRISDLRFMTPIPNPKSLITLKVYDLLGRQVATLVDGEHDPGEYEVQFDIRIRNWRTKIENLRSGVYFYRLSAGSFIQTKKMLIAK